MELWTNGKPLGFQIDGSATVNKIGTGQATDEKWKGDYAAEIILTGSRGGIYFEITGDEYARLARPDPVNRRSSAYQWTASGGGTNEYYLMWLVFLKRC